MSWLSRFLFGTPIQWKKLVDDSVLGELRFNHEDELWENRIEHNGRPVCFRVGGIGEPDEQLLATARDLYRRYPEVERQVSEFLAAEARSQTHWAEEIKQLRIAAVNVFWPKRPNDAMIEFD